MRLKAELALILLWISVWGLVDALITYFTLPDLGQVINNATKRSLKIRFGIFAVLLPIALIINLRDGGNGSS